MIDRETTSPPRGLILYDIDCAFCRNFVRRFRGTFEPRGFTFAPLQIHLRPGERPTEMRVRTVDGRELGGAAAVIFLARFVWWGQPLHWFAKLPGARFILRSIYLEIAGRRSCGDGGDCQLPEART